MRRSSSGYTLLEALLALTVTSLLGVPLLAMYLNSVRVMETSRARLSQVEFARSFLEEVRMTDVFKSAQGLYGDRYRYELRFDQEYLPDDHRFAEVLLLYRVTLTVDDVLSNVQPFKTTVHMIRENGA